MLKQSATQIIVLFFNFILLSTCSFANDDYTSDTALVNTLIKQSGAKQRVNVDSCWLLADQALSLAKQIKYPEGIASAYVRMSSVMMIRSKNDSALYFAAQSLAFSSMVHDHRRMTSALLLMSYVYSYKGKPDSAFAYIYKALGEAKQSKDSVSLMQIYVAIGNASLEYKDYSKATNYFVNAYEIALRMNRLSDATDALIGIGNSYYKQRKVHTALRYYMQVDSFSRVIGEETGVAQNQNNIALCYADLGQKEQALLYYRLALAGYKKFGMLEEETNLYYNLSNLYIQINQNDSAINFLNKAIPLAKKINDRVLLSHCLQMLAIAYAKKSDFKKAYEYHLEYTSISDSILNAEKISSISEMQTKYETDLKNSQIELLQGENVIAKLKASRSLGINIGLAGALLAIIIVASGFYNQNKKKQKLNMALSHEKKKSDDLLLNILPSEVAEELKRKGSAEAKQYNNVTVLFTDFVNFTGLSEQMSPKDLVEEIHRNFTAFDGIIDKYGLEKIKTIGDAYLAVCGLPNENANHAQNVTRAALAIRDYMEQNPGKFQVRIGIHSGPVVAGIVGIKKYAYDIWGDTVNTANRLESTSEAGKINISTTTYELIKREFDCTYRGKVNAKNKGEVDMYYVNHSLVST